ncbi:hypothetical protein C2845_PM03G23140 [Panicum miliaceum]|uniref:non-specific serine/threonine protein kinase n=1 Tax=Panicum miliaceum TaxID=4540 RepID=A0A3L6T918_PANMI|nr:hypothetical protein C2845_PM03G23140 [Panicum miliaceum]
MAFVITPRKNFLSALPGQYLGLTNIQRNGNTSNHLFAIEFDTIQNKEFSDIDANHVGANINGLRSLRSHHTGYYADEDGNFRNMSLISREAMYVWIDYDHKLADISVTMAPLKVARPMKPLFRVTYNLTEVLTDVAFIGFSSATGTINVRHCVLGWSFSMNGPAPAIDIARLPKLPRMGPKPPSKVLDIVLPITTSAFVLIVGTIVFLLIRRHISPYMQGSDYWSLSGTRKNHAKDSEEGSEDQFVYHGFSGVNLTMDGNAKVTPDGLLELTNDTVNLGHTFYPSPLNFRKWLNGTVQSFSVSFVFAILSVHDDISADGMAFFVSPTKNLSNTWAQYIGLLNSENDGNTSNHMFAVELDTIQNNEFRDIDNNHIGININSLHSLQAHHTGYYDDQSKSLKNLTLFSDKAMQVWVNYNGDASQINVTLAPVGTPKPKRPLLSAPYNLSGILKDPSYIGFSATTGAISTQHCVLGWSFAMNGPAPAIDISKLPKLPRIGPKPHSKVMEITLPIVTAAFVLIIGLVMSLPVYRRLRLYDHGTDPQTTHMVGTMGYLSPEFVHTGKASTLTDVFAFSIFLLEVTCAQRPVKQNPLQGNQNTLVDWVLDHWHNGLLSETVDTRLQGDFNADEACLVLKLGLLCSHPFTSARPSMHQVMQYLDASMPLPELTETHFSFTMRALVQNKGLESRNMLYPELTTSIGTFSSLSGGR